MTLVAGVDSSTLSCKGGRLRRRIRSGGPASQRAATEVDPLRWWDAWTTASAGLLDGVDAIAVAGQQHRMVALDAAGEVVRPALLWNDTRSAADAADLVAARGADAWAEAVGQCRWPASR